jgi:hypothetical protein
MADRLLLSISAQQATAARWRGRKLVDCRIYTSDETGLGSFRDYLSALPYMPALVMVDIVEEDYRFETLPHTFGPDRAEMVSRKLRQHYRNTPYMSAWLQGRETGKRRDDRYLFSALTNPDSISDWLEAIRQQGLPLAGVYLLPMVSAALPDRLQVKAPNLLLVAQHSGGLRLTFFRDRQFRLSRLTRGDGARNVSPSRVLADEISNTRLYLHALRTTTLDEHLTILILDRSDELVEITQTLARDNPSLDCTRLGAVELSSRLGIAPTTLAVSSDAIYLQLLGAKVPSSNLAPPAATVGFRQYQARRAIYAACGLVLMAGGGWSGYNFWQMLDFNSQTANATRQTSLHQTQYQEVTRQFPAAPTNAENLKKAVEVAQKLREDVRTPEPMMQVLSRALETSPNIVVKEFGWKYGTSELTGRGATLTAQEGPGTTTPAGASGAVARKQTGLIEGEVRPFRGDYRAAIATINQFAEQIARDPNVMEVRVEKLPLNVNPSLSLQGNTLDSRDQAATAEFRLAIAMKKT